MRSVSKKIPVNKIIKFINRYPRRCVIFLGHQDEPDEYAGALRDIFGRCSEAELLVVNFNLVNPRGLDSTNIKLVTLSDIFLSGDYETMDAAAYRLTRGWYRDLENKEGLTEHRNIKLAEMTEASIQQIFSKAVKNAHVISWAISLFKPQSVVIIDELGDLKYTRCFIEEEYRIPSLQIISAKVKFSAGGLIARIKGNIGFIVSLICDGVVRYLSLRVDLSGKDGLIDKDLYFLLKDKWVRNKFIPFSVWMGLKLRLQLLIQVRTLYIPVIIRKSFKYLISHRRFSNYWNRLKSSREFREQLRYKDIKIWALVERDMEEVITYTFPQLIRNLIFLERFYKKHSLKLIVLRDAIREPERSIIVAAKIAGIHTLVIQDGALSVENVYTNIHSDKVAVWGGYSAQWYKSFGNDISRCVVTGNLKYDLFFEREPFINTNEVYSTLGLDPEKKIILHIMDFVRFYPILAPSFFVDIERVIIEDLLGAIKVIPGTQLILKFHPFEDPDVWENTLRRYKNVKDVAIVKDFDFLRLIKISSLVTTVFSTGGIDAQLLGKPLISLNYFNTGEPIPYGKRGVALTVKKSDELVPAIKKIFEGGSERERLNLNRPAFIYDCAYKFDGKASERVLALMRSMLR